MGFHYNKERGSKIIELLREHVDQRGLALDTASWGRRRPRTCIFSTDQKENALMADKVWYLQDGAIRQWDGHSEIYFGEGPMAHLDNGREGGVGEDRPLRT